jgi:hypothetical protein
MKTLTYGVMPTKELFLTQFDATDDSPDYDNLYTYAMRGDDARTMERVGCTAVAKLSAEELFIVVQRLTDAFHNGNYDAGDLASSFLTTLGFEWI